MENEDSHKPVFTFQPIRTLGDSLHICFRLHDTLVSSSPSQLHLGNDTDAYSTAFPRLDTALTTKEGQAAQKSTPDEENPRYYERDKL